MAFWRSKVDNAKDKKSVYKIVKWHKAAPSYSSPPLRGPDGEACNGKDKAALLKSTLLDRQLDAEDFPPDVPTIPNRIVNCPNITDYEIFKAVCVAKSSSPGGDKVPAKILRACWPVIKDRVCHLFRKCVQIGIHPKIFKQAKIIMIPKNGQRDRTLPKSYRPIALLSCLGKGLKRLFAQRMAFLAVKNKILGRYQCSAVPKRCAIDLTTALTTDIQTAWDNNQAAAIATLDVRGAFDGVLQNRLNFRLRTQGWPENFVRWVDSFMSNRSATIIIDNYISEEFNLKCRLPQGSPASPILFLLYMKPLFKSASGINLGYADDMCLLVRGRTIPDCGQILQRRLDKVLSHANDLGIPFDIEKTELQYFHRKRDITKEVPLKFGQKIICSNDSTRWLGINFDRKVTFRTHINHTSTKALSALSHIRQLSSTIQDLSPLLARQAVQATALTALFYGTETWITFKNHRFMVGRIQKILNQATKAILPVYKTTPVSVLLRETGWAPAEAWPNRIQDRFSVRVAASDDWHPLRKRWDTSHITWLRKRIQVSLSSFPINAPWDLKSLDSFKLKILAVSKAAGARNFLKWREKTLVLDLFVFSDDSMSANRFTGGGYVIYRGNNLLSTGSVPLGSSAEVHDAEIAAAVIGTQAAISTAEAALSENIYLCLDNEAAANILA